MPFANYSILDCIIKMESTTAAGIYLVVITIAPLDP